jgi:hypothetical protein
LRYELWGTALAPNFRPLSPKTPPIQTGRNCVSPLEAAIYLSLH